MTLQNTTTESFPVSRNVKKMQASSTLKAAQVAGDLRERGFDVIDLSVGEPDFQTPEFIILTAETQSRRLKLTRLNR